MESEMELWCLSKSWDPGEPCEPGRLGLCLSTVAGLDMFGWFWMCFVCYKAEAFEVTFTRKYKAFVVKEAPGKSWMMHARTNLTVGIDMPISEVNEWYDFLCCGCCWRHVQAPTRELRSTTCVRFEQAGWCVWVALTPPHRVYTFSSIPGVGGALISECPAEGRLLLIKYVHSHFDVVHVICIPMHIPV